MKKASLFTTSLASVAMFAALASSAHAAVFTRDLDWGAKGDQVTQLQTFLTTQGLYSGEITGGFYAGTLKALKAFQAREGLSPVNGYFGPKTRARTNELMGNGASASNPSPITPPTSNLSTPNTAPITKVVGKVSTYEGIITQVNMGDNTFIIRLRDGSLLTVKNPLESPIFVNVKGIIDAATGFVGNVSDIAIRDKAGSDAIPTLSGVNPGTGTVGTKLTLNGTGFMKSNNSITIGNIKNAVTGLASADGTTLSFTFPAAPCDATQAKSTCAQRVIEPGEYTISLANTNGISNTAKFIVLSLPQLSITTDLVPQVTAGNRYQAEISAMGGAEGYVWRISEGKLPAGLLFSQSACTETPCKSSARISGIPPTPGTHTFTVTLVSGQETVSRQYSIVVVQPLSNPY